MNQVSVGEWLTQRSRERLQEIFQRVKHFGLGILDQTGNPVLPPIHGFTLAEVAQLKARCDLLEQAVQGLSQRQAGLEEGPAPAGAVKH